jgi:hypothetical protein
MKNTCGDRELIGVVNVHSTIDLITNSSTEIFCVIEGSSAEAVQDVVDGILEEVECSCLQNSYEGLTVEPYVKWDDEKGDEVKVEGQFAIWAEYGARPCKVIMKRLDELLTIVETND